MDSNIMRVVVFCLGTFTATASQAETNLNTLLKNYDAADSTNKVVIEAIVQSSQTSVSWANAYLKVERHEKPFYCPPRPLVLSVPQTFDILRRAVKSETEIGNLPFGAAMIYAMQKAFPCDGKSN